MSLAQSIIQDVIVEVENYIHYGKSRFDSLRFHKNLLSKPFSEEEKKEIKERIERTRQEIAFARNKALQTYKRISIIKKLVENTNDDIQSKKDVEKYELNVWHNYTLANQILEYSEYTEAHNASYYFNERIENDFIGTYKITIERTEDYSEFIKVLAKDAAENNINVDFSISFEEWKNGYIQEGKRQTRIGKFLKKKGFSKYTIDFYSQQVKTEKDVYLTISDRVQHIAGMSFYSPGNWDGMGGSSCQDPKNDHPEVIHLLGSLHDNKLLIAFLHESIEDLGEMEHNHDCGVMLARTMCRIIHVNGKQFLIGTKLYGNFETKNMLEKCLRQLNKFNIFSHTQMAEGKNTRWHLETANGYAEKEETYYDVPIRIEGDYLINCECPVCDGTGKYEIEIETYDYRYRDVTIDCPACGGSGEYETYVYINIDEYQDIEDTEEIAPYDEYYDHNGSNISILINTDLIK